MALPELQLVARAVACVNVVAFASFHSQAEGLIGPSGLDPAAPKLARAATRLEGCDGLADRLRAARRYPCVLLLAPAAPRSA